ncbi:SusC/RagA family TonB-linked outer membrane protein [Sphingobacterium alkalisoli]|uniref:SusC/RagA family TonB-linked outer membrane protein n=1 Tax=Sphingobacterium alkalisoli TaxID=1874115 RepID=A0A4U0GY10_9SPHI|nr:SusC/RagA family TonB-linked outer membrane protein [Sphingobacterium alkalisoli]TJY63968.1 SusC/RagA family TonB-linked outer membrane protein [Sphingobacterium alkalisoli]GGH23745.1 SusC/RagA family TonB-linked outer membrane protein [Sphingobacterium alkalisoli]
MNLSYFIRVIKLSTFLYFVVCLQIGHAAYPQTVTYTGQNTALATVLQVVKQQIAYEVLGTKDLLNNASPVSIVAKNMPLEAFLDKILTPRNISYRIVDRTIVLERKPQGKNTPSKPIQSKQDMPQQTIRGQVLGSDGAALGGASFAIDGKTIAVADQAGNFTLPSTIGERSVTVTMIGYKPTVFKLQDGKLTYNIQMQEEAAQVDEVIVTGYQTIKKDSYTGTAITKSGEELRQVNPQNVLQAMQVFDPSFKLLDNNLAGANPNTIPNINVRGSSALPAGSGEVLRRDNITGTTNMPAFILDGYEVSVQKVLDLDMTRIETVTILKDAAATAIYGSRAANGVMVITTKAPKEGKLQLTYSHESNVNAPDISDYNVLHAPEKLEFERLSGLFDSEIQRQPQSNLDELYYSKLANVLGGVDSYWLSQPLRTAVGQKHGLFVEGGSETFRYGVDVRYQTRPGVMKGSDRNQYSGGLNFNYNLKNKIRFFNELAITVVQGTESPYGDYVNYVLMNPYYRMRDDNGNIIQRVDTWRRVDASGNTNDESVLNPLYNATLNSFNRQGYTEVLNNFAGDFDLGNGLRLRGQVSLMKRMNTADEFISPMANEFYNYSTDRTDEKGSYESYYNNELQWDANVRLNWLRRIGKSDFNVVGGTNIRTENMDERSFTAIGFPNDRFQSIGFAKGYAENASPYSSLALSRLFGAFLSTNYSYDNRFLMDATVRMDGSSKFGDNNRTAPFWSFGLGWNVHNESWFQNDVINLFRLRATTGLTGSVNFAPYMSTTTYTYDQTNWYSSGIGASVRNYGNEDLTWQKTQNTDVGIDLGLFNDRITLSPRLYYKLTKDILTDLTVAPSTGFASYKENLGDMENKGFEINFNAIPIRNKDWTLSLMANLVRNENKIVRISNSLKSYNDRVDEEQQEQENLGVPFLRFKEGQSVDAIYAVPSLGIDPESGREVYLNRHGSLTYDWNARDITVVAVATPKLEGFFGGTLRYKQLTAVAYFQARMGAKMYNQTLVDRVENADPRYNVDSRVLAEKWKNPGDVTFYKSIQDQGQTRVSSRFIMPDNLLALQSVFLSYDFETAWVQKMSLSRLRLGLTANDIFRMSTVRQERGINYPFARSISFSLQAAL